jgi:hypothetical protein
LLSTPLPVLLPRLRKQVQPSGTESSDDATDAPAKQAPKADDDSDDVAASEEQAANADDDRDATPDE